MGPLIEVGSGGLVHAVLTGPKLFFGGLVGSPSYWQYYTPLVFDVTEGQTFLVNWAGLLQWTLDVNIDASEEHVILGLEVMQPDTVEWATLYPPTQCGDYGLPSGNVWVVLSNHVAMAATGSAQFRVVVGVSSGNNQSIISTGMLRVAQAIVQPIQGS